MACILLSVDFTLHKINLFIGERMIILHAGYNEGFEPNAEVVFRALSFSGDYHRKMSHKMIVCWLEDKLVPNLPPKCVLVMDNATYHNVQVDKRPLMATTKHLIKEWLTKHGIQWSAGILIDELLELCKTHPQEYVYHLTRIKKLILEAMQSITAKHWPDCINHVKGIEVIYWARDARTCGYKIWIQIIMTLRQT